MSFRLHIAPGKDRTPPALCYQKPSKPTSSVSWKSLPVAAKNESPSDVPTEKGDALATSKMDGASGVTKSGSVESGSWKSPREIIASSYQRAKERKSVPVELDRTVLCKSMSQPDLERASLDSDPVHLAGTMLRVLCDDAMRTQPAWIVRRQEKVLTTIRNALDAMDPDRRARSCNAILENAPRDVHSGQIRRLLDRGLSVPEFLATLVPPVVHPPLAFRPTELESERSFL